MRVDDTLRVLGSILVIVAHFVAIHVSLMTGIVLHLIADTISVPYFIRMKAWDVVIMLSFLTTISLTKFVL